MEPDRHSRQPPITYAFRRGREEDGAPAKYFWAIEVCPTEISHFGLKDYCLVTLPPSPLIYWNHAVSGKSSK